MAPVITLTTDFGLADGYVAAMKGVILGIEPRAVIVDVTHEAPAQDVFGGAYVLSTVYGYFPPGTIHVAVVDPGVGSARKALAVRSAGRCFVGPDNGVLSLCLPGRPAEGTPFETAESPVPAGSEAVELVESRFRLPEVSASFHGRDIFAPVAAHLAAGVPIEALGPPVGALRRFFVPEPSRCTDDAVRGVVVHVDRFGNAITNLRREHLPQGGFRIEAGTAMIGGASPSYAALGGPGAVWGSARTLEIAVRDGSAARALGLRRGDPVTVRPRPLPNAPLLP